MKNLLTITLTTITLISLSACSSKDIANPSQNEELNSVSVSSAQKEKDGMMQTSLDKWLKDDWTPTIEKSEKIKEIEKDKGRDFTLQEYVDKAEVYQEEKRPSTTKSHVKEMNSLPVIGK